MKPVIGISLLLITMIFGSLKLHAQHQQEVLNAVQAYFIVPVSFIKMSKWIEDVENDSTLIFKEKKYFAENDSVSLRLQLERPGSVSPVKHSRLSALVTGKTFWSNMISYDQVAWNTMKLNEHGPVKFFNLAMYAYITFDSTESGKQLALETQKDLEKAIGKYYRKSKPYIAPKKLTKRIKHPDVKRSVVFRNKKNPLGVINVSNSFNNHRYIVWIAIYSLIKFENIGSKN